MKGTARFIWTICLLAHCTNPQQPNESSLQQDSALLKTNSIFINPFRDINRFDIKVGDHFTDSLHDAYARTVKPTVVQDICVGDNCESHQVFVNNDNHSTFYFFKGDGGEYGFSNNQYLLQNDSLVFVRDFSVGIEKWPTDSTNTLWMVQETTYHFRAKNVTAVQRYALTEDLHNFDYTLRQYKPELVKVVWEGIYAEKAEELRQLLGMK